MPFRCKCGRTFEKPNTFSSHTSSCALFHERRMSSSPPKTSCHKKVTPLDMSSIRRYSFTSRDSATSPLSSSSPSPTMDYPAFMPTALTIQNAFEGVRRRSLSYDAAFK